jgi:hypothetical protein
MVIFDLQSPRLSRGTQAWFIYGFIYRKNFASVSGLQVEQLP